MAKSVRMRKRHWGLLTTFVFLILAPLAIAVYYLWFVSVDQYASTVGFTVRKEESGSATDLIGGLTQFTGIGGASDSDILYEFIQSQELVGHIDKKIGLSAHYDANWTKDPLFSLWPDATIEDLLWFWQRVVRISYNQASGLITLRVLAFEPEFAQLVADEILIASQQMINQLNAAARADLMRYAQADLAEAQQRLKLAREQLTLFHTRTQIVDPTADLQGQMGIVNNLQQQLAEAMIEYDLVNGTTSRNDPRVAQARRRIDVIRRRIGEERKSFAVQEIAGVGKDYPTLMAEYESLVVDREFAEETYHAALTAMDIARANSSRQSRYLAAYTRPTLAQSAEYPQRFVLFGLTALFLIMAWAIFALVYYSIRDRR